MRSTKYLWNVCMKIYRQMYKEADPSADWDKLLLTSEVHRQNWFMNYFLDENRAGEIFDSICKEHKITRAEKRLISTEIWLGAAPGSVRKD